MNNFLTVDLSELRKQWMKLYLNLMSLKSHNLIAKEILANHQQKFAETNEYMMEFFDKLGAE